jgi:hypothetical protein
MHYVWNVVVVSKAQGVVRAFHCEKNERLILKKALSSINYCRKEMSIPSELSSNCTDVSLLIKECIRLCNSPNVNWSLVDENKELYSEVMDVIREIDWRAFISSGAKPDRERNKYESALFLLGLNPISKYLPFADGWVPPSDLQLEALASAIQSIRGSHRHCIADLANKEQSAIRMEKFHRFIRKLYPEHCFSESVNARLNSAFR